MCNLPNEQNFMKSKGRGESGGCGYFSTIRKDERIYIYYGKINNILLMIIGRISYNIYHHYMRQINTDYLRKSFHN